MNRITGFAAVAAIAAAMTTSAFAAAPTATAPATTPPAASAPAAPAAATKAPMAQKTAERHESMSRKRVEAIQAALNQSGETVKVDGILGHKTTAALKDFQQKHGIKATGRADKATLSQLKVANS